MPAIPVSDLNAGISFYEEIIGFKCVFSDPGGYAVLHLDQVELHLWLANDESWIGDQRETPVISGAETFIAGTHSCRIMVNDIQALFARYEKAGKIHPLDPPEKKPWGATEFVIRDPYNNLVIFFEWN
ncbi:MAG: VOC family protein [Rhizobiaceae bacterium]|nr:VOC family protein [Rhizobiaceae bacterium]